jgi:hypothetical protein
MYKKETRGERKRFVLTCKPFASVHSYEQTHRVSRKRHEEKRRIFWRKAELSA